MTNLTAWIWRGAVDRVLAATRALPGIGNRHPAALDQPPAEDPSLRRAEQDVPPMRDQQHVNPADRLERGHPKR
jgi:hypothetical protein